MEQQAIDILILANGPGELVTWVRPVVHELRSQWGEDRQQLRISLVLSPCPHATGREAAIARSYPAIDRVQEAEHFLVFLLLGKTAENWDWRKRGVVLFLGGDQFFPVLIGRRLGYKTVIYAEWEARWYRWLDRFGVMQPNVLAKVPQRYRHKLTVIGDLMADVAASAKTQQPALQLQPDTELIGLLPGSKPAKLLQGLPLLLATAEEILALRPQARFVIPVAPTLDLRTLADYADPRHNPTLQSTGRKIAELVIPPTDEAHRLPYLETLEGVKVELWTQSPAYTLLSQCYLCLTTVGANTAELGALAVPMIVLLPTQQLDAMRAWDGLPGLLANLPGIGSFFARLINGLVLRQGKLFAWPNIWAGEEVVPELVGQLQPRAIGKRAVSLLRHPERLNVMRTRLQQVRGNPGATQKLVRLVAEQICQ